MSGAAVNLANALMDTQEEFSTMLEYASIIVADNPQERKNRNTIKRELHNKYRERNRRRKVVKV